MHIFMSVLIYVKISVPKQPVIPKFSSFKAPTKALPKTLVPEGKPEHSDPLLTIATPHRDKRGRKDSSEHKAQKHRPQTNEGHYSRSRSPTKHRDKRRRTVSPSTPPPARVESDIYKLDLKGDVSNITYGTLYRYSVPNFHRFGAGYILGLPAQWRIDREKGEGKGLVVGIRGYDADKRRRGGNMFAVDASRVGRLKALDGIQKGFGPNDEFVPVSGRVEDTAEDHVEQDYRSIEGKAKLTAPEDIESVSSDDEGTFSYSEELRQRTIELDRKLQSHPHDIQAWLDYVSLQDEIGVGQKASTAEIKLGSYGRDWKRILATLNYLLKYSKLRVFFGSKFRLLRC